jgi:putative transposase
MASVRPLTELTVADLWREVKDEETLWGDVSRQTLRAVKLLLENRMHDELADYLNAGTYTRTCTRRGYRNGVYMRRLTTTWGTIPDLEIPRARARGFLPSVVQRYQRRTNRVNTLVRRVFLGGLSTRRVGPVLAELLEDTVSPTTVSKITQALDQAVAAFHTRPLADRYQYLFLDAVSLRVKTPDGTKRRQALVAYGITPQGHRELIDYRLVRLEGYATWEAFLVNLACRGLAGASVRLITTDGHRDSMRPWSSSIPMYRARPAGSTSCAMSPAACASAIGPCASRWRGASIRPGVALPRSGRSTTGATPGSAPPRRRWPVSSATGKPSWPSIRCRSVTGAACGRPTPSSERSGRSAVARGR